MDFLVELIGGFIEVIVDKFANPWVDKMNKKWKHWKRNKKS